MLKFTAILHPVEGMNATYVTVPFVIKEAFGTEGMVKVMATIDKASYRGIIRRMEKNGPHVLIVTQAIRQQIKKTAGEKVTIVIKQDTEARTIEIPADLLKLLQQHNSAYAFFKQLSYTNRKEYVQWIESAKRDETRRKRLHLIMKKLNAKHKNLSAKG